MSNVGAFGPFPNMYDPLWYTEKTLSVWAEGIAAVAALALFVVLHLEARNATTRSYRPGPWRRALGAQLIVDDRARTAGACVLAAGTRCR